MNAAVYIAGAVAIAATAAVITRMNAIHALLYMIVSLLAVAVIFFACGAPFVAALEVIVYAGAIMVLFIFAMMMLDLGPASVGGERQWASPRAWAGPAALSAVLCAEFLLVAFRAPSGATAAGADPAEVGRALFSRYLVGVELASMLLLSGLVGAYHLGRRLRGE